MIEIPGYTLHRQLGRGGMAVVYLATQQTLNRDVALKVLSPSTDPAAGERFLREAQLAANLHHPHIVPIHDFGVHNGQAYIAMEYLAGGCVAPLSGERLAPQAALRIVRDIADALDYAHGRGVVHRDIKPDNILRGNLGGAVLSDFGIARLIQGESVLTSEGCSVGTPHYMSPEQLRGEKLDGRSDLYSLGVVLWQLLTGELPYSGSDSWAIGTQHLGADIPRLPSDLAHLQGLVDSLMAKQAGARMASGADVVRRIDALLSMTPAAPGPSSQATVVTPAAPALGFPDRRSVTPMPRGPSHRRALYTAAGVVGITIAFGAIWLGKSKRDGSANGTTPASAATTASTAATAATAAAKSSESLSLAVLPFDDMSEKRDQSYFSDGIAEELSNRLANVAGLRVTGRTSAQSFKDKRASIADIGRALKVNRILEGSVRRNGDQLRVTVQLTNVADGFQIWSQTFDRKLTDVFAVQDEIAGAVVDTLKLKLLGVARRHTPRVEVYDLYLRARQSLIRGSLENTKRAHQLLREAVAQDPDYAEAFAMLAMTEVFLAPYAKRDPEGNSQAMQRGIAAAEHAVALDPQLGDAYGSRGFVRRLQWDWTGALADAEKSVALGPQDSRNHLRHAVILLTLGRLQEGEAAAVRAIELDPMLTPAWHQLGMAKAARGDFAGTLAAYRRAVAIDPSFLAASPEDPELLLLDGKPLEARAIYAASERGEIGVIMCDYSLGRKAEARLALERLVASNKHFDAYVFAEAFAWLGEDAKAFALLDTALAERHPGMPYLIQDPLLRSLHDDPRFAKLQERMGLPALP